MELLAEISPFLPQIALGWGCFTELKFGKVVRVEDPLGRWWLLGFGINTDLHLFGASSLKETGCRETVGLMVTACIQSREGEIHRNPKEDIDYTIEPRQKLLPVW